MSNGTYNPRTGRTTHISERGRMLESKRMYFLPDEWALLLSLSKDDGVTLGRCIVGMAHSEKRRRLHDYENRLDNLSGPH